jgi:hypothetical protein
MAGHGRKNVDDAILLALAAGANPSGAAAAAKCSERTVRRRLQDSAFRSRVSGLRSELVQGVVGRLATLGRKAADGLNDLMGSSREQTRLGARRLVLDFLFKGTELLEIEKIEARLAAIEEAQQKAQETRR